MLNRFAKEKSDFLSKKDKSRKGSIDKGIIRLVSLINSKNDYYTTSSCAGRIVLLEMHSSKKYECHWILAKHEKVKFNEIFNALKNHKSKNEVWLKQQPVILHVACMDIEASKMLLESAQKVFKRSGIISIKENKVMLEVIGSEHLETLIKKGRIMPDEEYLKELVKRANYNFGENRKKIGKFERLLQNIL
ncbi:hypothetical protein HYS31_04335 [Candidatus Woesearchaeota archaeon]|nr:hypothetical protein [Candidatus Woesearchaeota archaeon]